MSIPGALPQIGKLGEVKVNQYELKLVPGTYDCHEPQRIATKISTGDVRYADFTPYESIEAQGLFNGGYGLRRYSDVFDPNAAHTQILEANGVDPRAMPVILGPQTTTSSLSGPTSPVVWIGEFVPGAGAHAGQTLLVVVAQTKVFFSTNGAGWTDSGLALNSTPLVGAIGEFGGYLIFGYGTGGAAQATNDLASLTTITDDETPTPQPMNIWAFTADRANAYVAGGHGTSLFAQVMSSPSGTNAGIVYQTASITKCGDTQIPITGLAPGGGLTTLYVAKQTELGEIDNNGTYRKLVPFQVTGAANGVGLQWILADSQDQQKGPLALVFPYDRAPWFYTPDTTSAGQARNLAVWADSLHRPPTVRGNPTAFCGSARFLYYVLQTSGGHSYLVTLDQRTGATSGALVDLGAVTVNSMCISQVSGLVTMYIGQGVTNTSASVVSYALPSDGDFPLDDANCRFTASGTLKLPASDFDLPDEDKISVEVRVLADGLVAGQQEIQVAYLVDDGTSYTQLGVANQSPRSEIAFPTAMAAWRRLGLELTFTTTDATKTPQLWAVTVRASLNPRIYREWTFQAYVPAGQMLQGDDLTDPSTMLQNLWIARQAGLPITFIDRWGFARTVRLIELRETETQPGGELPPEGSLAVRLLELPNVAAPTTTNTYTVTQGAGQAWFPMGFPGNGLLGGTIDVFDTYQNAGSGTVYPVWTITGPGKFPALTNVTTGAFWSLNRDLPHGEVITVNMRTQTVTNQDGVSLTTLMPVGAAFWGLAPGTTQVHVQLGRCTNVSQIANTRSDY